MLEITKYTVIQSGPDASERRMTDIFKIRLMFRSEVSLPLNMTFNMKKKLYTFLLIASIFYSCTKTVGKLSEKTPPPPVTYEPKYNTDIKPFINLKCAVGGCHVGNFIFGDFNNYDDLKQRIDNGKVKTLVFDNKLMPPYGSVQLTNGEINKLKGWINYGAEQN
jgi:hypothetical protein